MPILKDYEVFSKFSKTHQKEMNYLRGKVYEDERFPDGSEIETSAIIDMVDDVMAMTTRGATYFLKNKKRVNIVELTEERIIEVFDKSVFEVLSDDFIGNLEEKTDMECDPLSKVIMQLTGVMCFKQLRNVFFEKLKTEVKQ